MKLRSFALALTFAVATTGVVAPTVQAEESQTTADQTMAEQYEPEFGEIPKPFIGNTSTQKAGTIPYSGLPDGAKMTVLNPNFGSYANRKNGLLVQVYSNSSIWLNVFPEYMKGDSASNSVKFFVSYPDGSTEVVEHTFTVYPLQKVLYSPRIDDPRVYEGVDDNLEILELPEDAQVEIVEAPTDWEIEVNGNALSVRAPQVGSGDVVTYVTFSDGSTAPVTFQIDVEPKPGEPLEKPTVNSGSSSGASIIALILGLLGLGGAAFFFLNQMVR